MKKIKQRSMLTWARIYVSHGFSAIPLQPKTKKPHPKLLAAVGWLKGGGRPTWEPAKTRLPTEEELETWFAGRSPEEVGIGLVIPEGVAVVDLETPALFSLFFNGTVEEIAQFTWVCRTGKGLHVYLGLPTACKPAKVDGWIEIRTRGLLVTAPPSIHPSGKAYTWLSDPERTPIGHVDEEALRRLLKKVEMAKKWKRFVEALVPAWTPSARHNLAGPLAGYLRKRGIPQEEAEFVVRAVALLAGDDEVRDRLRYVRDTYQKPLSDVQGLSGLRELLDEDIIEAIKKAFPVERDGEPVELEHLTDLEEPRLSGRDVVVDAVVASTSIPYTIPARYRVRVIGEEEDWEDEPYIPERSQFVLQLVGVSERRKQAVLLQFAGAPTGRPRIDVLAWRTVYRVRVRPVVFSLERKDGKVVDEKGREWKHFDIYIVANERLPLEPGTVVRLHGRILPDPRTQKVTLLVYRVEFPDHAEDYDPENIRRLLRKFEGWSVGERVDWILEQIEKGSGIVGRQDVALTYLLDAFTPLWLELEGQPQRGWANSAILGDSTTGKSALAKWITTRVLKAGLIITAELASLAGLTGTARQLAENDWFVDWGLLPLNHRKWIIIDGAHKLPKDAYAALAETERSGVVVISKAGKGIAPAQVRLTKIFNPLNPENWRETKNLREFYRPVQGLPTVLDRVSIARLDRCIFVDSRDVGPEEVNRPRDGDYDPDLELLADVRGWCWSGRAKVSFDRDAWAEILDKATEIYDAYFVDAIPLASIDTKFKLARMAAALAFLTLSTDESLREVRVTKEHVDFVVGWLRAQYDRAGLGAYAKESRYEGVTEEEVRQIIREVAEAAGIGEEQVPEIFKFIVHQGRVTKEQIKQKFSLADKTQLRPLVSTLQNLDLIKRGNGFYPTSRLIDVVKLLDREGSPDQRGGGYFSDHGKQGNQGKETSGTDSPDEEAGEIGPGRREAKTGINENKAIEEINTEVGATRELRPVCHDCPPPGDIPGVVRAPTPDTSRGVYPPDHGKQGDQGADASGPLGSTGSLSNFEVVDVCHVCLKNLQEDPSVEVHFTGQRPGGICAMCGKRGAVVRVRYRVKPEREEGGEEE